MSNLFWLTDEQMARLAPISPRAMAASALMIDAFVSVIIFVNRNGLRWRDAPKEYGPAKTLYNRWKRWATRAYLSR
ncbi:transposase [Escherichia coli]